MRRIPNPIFSGGRIWCTYIDADPRPVKPISSISDRERGISGGQIPAPSMDSPATNQSVEDKAPAIDPSERHPLEEDKASVMDLSGKGKAPMEKKKKKKTKTKMARFTQAQINNCMAFKEEMPDFDNMPSIIEILGDDLAKCSQEYIDELKAIDDSREEDKKFWIEMNRQIREEREGILNQYYTKGYAEYEVDDDEDEDEGNKGHARVAATSGRRRFRHGVALKKNQSGGGSIRKI
uniref:Uncharacterized protein n=1 Tax=Oryza rufipogon TaxID=4529 RepID=A0A0E0NPZ8_ORYRU